MESWAVGIAAKTVIATATVRASTMLKSRPEGSDLLTESARKYPKPIVDHAVQKTKAIALFKAVHLNRAEKPE